MILKARWLEHLNFVLWVWTIQQCIRFVECQTVPQCAIACIASTDGCSSTDNKCLCTNAIFINQATSCIQSNCEGMDITNAEAFLQDTCEAVGVTLTTFATASTFSHIRIVTSTLLGPGLASGAITSDTQTTSSTTTSSDPFSSSTGHPSGSNASGDVAPTTSDPGAPSGNPGARKSPVPILAGVLSSVGLLIFGATTGLCLLRRWRTRKAQIADQYVVVPPMTPYMLPASGPGRSLEGKPREDNLDPFRSEDDENVCRESTSPIAKSNIGLRDGGTGEAVVWMQQVSEIREEVARLRQLLMNSRQSPSNIPIPDQTTQLSEMREEMQRLRHLVSLQVADRRNIFDGVSRTTSLPAYEE